MKWFLVTFIKLYSTWGWRWDKKYTPIINCNNIKFPAAITGRTPSPCCSHSREADSSLIFCFLHFVLPHFLKSTQPIWDFSINMKTLLELLRRVGCNHLFTRFCSSHSFLGLPKGFKTPDSHRPGTFSVAKIFKYLILSCSALTLVEYWKKSMY